MDIASEPCYKGSEHEFDSKAFYGRCSHSGPTVTLVKSTNGNVFGGYTDIAWENYNNRSYKTGNLNSFLFYGQNQEYNKL